MATAKAIRVGVGLYKEKPRLTCPDTISVKAAQIVRQNIANYPSGTGKTFCNIGPSKY